MSLDSVVSQLSILGLWQDVKKCSLSYSIVMGRTIGCSSSITIKWTCLSSFDVRKNDVRASSMGNLVNVVKALLGSKFDVRSFEAKNRVFEFDHQQMNTFEFVRCSKNDVCVSSMSYLINLVKALLGLKFDVWSFEAKNRVFEFDHQ